MAWTEQEIKEYGKIRMRELGPLYATAGININNPEERARYLAEDVLKLTMTDQDIIMSIAKERGKAQALKELEITVLSTFF